MNERVVATALYYVDSDNITPTSLFFRMTTDPEQDGLSRRIGRGAFTSYEQLFGTKLTNWPDGTSLELQNFGNIETCQGRMLAFPNVFHHRVSPFKLENPTKPGHRLFIALWLVDPHQRIISTGDVPPQQLDWWTEAVFGGTDPEASKGEMPAELFWLLLGQGLAKIMKLSQELLASLRLRLPTELMDMVREERALPDGIMTSEEAQLHRLALMQERSAA